MPRSLPQLLLGLGLSTVLCLPLWAQTPSEAPLENTTSSLDVNIFHTGDIKGLASSYLYDVRLPYFMTSDFVQNQSQAQAIEDFGVARTTVYFHAQGHYLWGEKFGVEALKQFLAQGEQATVPLRRENLQVLTANDSLILPGTDPALFQALSDFIREHPRYHKQVRWQAAVLTTYPGGVQHLRLPDALNARPENPLLWEMVLGFDLHFKRANSTSSTGSTLPLIGKPFGEGTRRMALVERLRTPDSLLVDSGNLLEGLSSVLTDHLSFQRANSLKMAQQMGYFAINVGKEELRGGLLNLLREQDTYQLPLISASIRQQGNYVFSPYKIHQVGDKKIAFIGLTDPKEINALRALEVISEDTEILPPRAALEQILPVLKREAQPDVVVILGDLSESQLQALEKYNRDAHLVLTDTESPLQKLEAAQTTPIDTLPRAFVPPTSAYALNKVHVHADRQQLQLRSEMYPITFDLPPLPRFLPAILDIRQEVYKDALDELIPNMGPILRNDPELLKLFLNSANTVAARERLSGYHTLSDAEFLQIYQPYITRELLYNLEMNLLMDRYQGEVVVFKNSGQDALSVPGAMPRMLVYERLKLNDTLHMYTLNGDQIKALSQIASEKLTFGGLRTSDNTVWGRPLGGKKVYYRVLMPSGVARLSAVQQVLQDTPNQAPRDVYLRNVLLQEIERLAQQPDTAEQLAQRMRPRWHEKQTLFTLGLDDLQLNISGYNAVNNQAYTEVRETRVISPNSFNFGARTRLYSGLDNPWMGWTNAIQAKYEGLSVVDVSATGTGERFTENQDDLLFSSELQLRLFKFSLFDAQLPLTPFVEGVYDTEFTPTLNTDTQQRNPLQSELRGVFGLSIPGGDRLKTFKTGLALRRDFNVPNNLEGGVDLKFVHEQPVNSALTWHNDLDARYFLPSPNDNASSLGLTAQWVSSLRLSLTDNLSLRFFADTYVFQGKLPATSQLGASFILGVGLGYDRLWKPVYEPLFGPTF